MSAGRDLAVRLLLAAGLLACAVTGFADTVPPKDDTRGAATSPAPPDPRPVVRLGVVSALHTEDKVFAQVMEGRLVTDLADMETFRTVAADHPGDLRLTCTIRALSVNRGSSIQDIRDAESDGSPRTKEMISASMDLEVVLEDSSGTERLRQKLNVQASHEIDISNERTAELVTQELIDRTAQKIEKLLRKRVRR